MQDAPLALLTPSEPTGLSANGRRNTFIEALSNRQEPGGRNNRLASIAGHYIKAFPEMRDVVVWHVRQANAMTPDPLGEAEVTKIIDSIWSKEHSSVTDEPELLKRYNISELLSLDRTFKWAAKGLIAKDTYGMWAGEQKTLKSTTADFAALSVASGVPLFDRFEVPEPGPVVMYVGEGGKIPTTQRLERQAHAMGVDLSKLPIELLFDTAPVLSEKFQATLRRDLADIQPVLVVVDPLYAFHGGSADARNLHQEGELLNAMSGPCGEAGAALVVVNHFNQTGNGKGLHRITMAGGAEWCDSWWLLSHREAPRVATGDFSLALDVGSRQWGGTEWELDIHLGAFDDDLGEHVGDISWELRRASEGTRDDPRSRLMAIATAEPFVHTKEELAKKVGGRIKDTRFFIDLLNGSALETQMVVRRRTDGRPYTVATFGPTSQSGRQGTLEGIA